MTEPALPSLLLQPKDHDEPRVFHVKNLLREARRQRQLETRLDPDVCLLDPDGDVVRHLRRSCTAIRAEHQACYHSELWLTTVGGREIGIVPCAVGAPQAVFAAEELAATGCTLLISISPAGA